MEKRPSVVVRIPKGSKVLLLEDSDLRTEWFVKRVPGIVAVTKVEDAIAEMLDTQFDFMFLDHDLGLLDYLGCIGPEGNGLTFAKHLASTAFVSGTIFIHSWNPNGAKAMKDCLPNAVVIPFGRFEVAYG